MASPPPPTPRSGIATVPTASGGRYATQGMISPVAPPFVDPTTGTLAPTSFRFLYGLFSDIQTLQAGGGGGGTVGPPGPQGPTGPPGPAGSAATVNVGTTATGAPGTPASVTNSGSTSAAVFNFTVPAGVQGAAGATGATGPPGNDGAPGATGPQGPPGTPATVGGTNGQIQYNAAGALGGFTASGDATINTGNGAVTLATVNSNVGTWNNVTVNAKGLVTAGSSAAYLTGNQTITLSGDVTGSGATSIAATVARLQGQPVSATAPSNGQVLQWSGTAWAPATPAAPGTGTVTSVTAGAGLTGGTITTSGTIALSSPVAVANGGTGAATAPAAIANLGAMPRAGVTDGSNAAAGQIGEYLIGQTLYANRTAVTSGTVTNVQSISLTAGDWDVWGNVMYNPNGATTVSIASIAISTVSGTMPDISLILYVSPGAATPYFGGPAPMQRVSITATTTVYICDSATFTGAGLTHCGFIAARRVR